MYFFFLFNLIEIFIKVVFGIESKKNFKHKNKI